MAAGLRAMILDFDGVIIDTESVELHLWQEFYRAHGLELSATLWSNRVGLPDNPDVWQPIKHFEMMTGQPLSDRLQRDMIRRFHERCHAEPLRPGIEDLVERASQRGFGLGVASSNSRYWVLSFLHQHSIWEHFTTIRTIEDVSRGKPAPDLYLSAAEALGTPAKQCLAIEDAPNGIRAALAAGVGCVIAVPNDLTALLPFPSGIHEKVTSLEGFDPLAAYHRARVSLVL